MSVNIQPYLSECLVHAQNWAQQAGQQALMAFRRYSDVEWKSDGSPVTMTDRAIESWLREQIMQRYPQHAVMGEEYGGEWGDEWTWVLDPIDGTRSFARGIPIFGIQLALCYGPEPVLGVIAFPALNEMVSAAQGLGCRWNGQICRVSEVSTLEQSLLHVHEQRLVQAHSPEFWQYLQGAQLQRNWGDGYSFVLVATGRAEAALDPRMELWDSAPLPVLLKEAGGVFVDWKGHDTIHGSSAIAVNSALAPALLAQLNQYGILASTLIEE